MTMTEKKRNRTSDRRLKLTIVERLYKGSGEAKRLAAWRADLIKELGGEDALTVAKRETVEQACRLKLALDRADLSPTLDRLDMERSTTLRRALLYTLKLLGLSADRRVTPVRPRSRVQEIGARLVAERQERERTANAAKAGNS